MEGLSMDNILDEGQIEDLFPIDESQEAIESEETPEEKEETDNNEDTTEVDPDTLFDEPESVGSEDNKVKEGTPAQSTSQNFYSSIANALVEDGIFQNLTEEDISGVTSADDFAEIISKQVRSQLDERLRRIDDALNYGVEVPVIQQYENALQVLNNITDEQLSDESEQGENIRRNIIYQDYINRGYPKDRAAREVKKSFDAGSDIEDAREAIQANRQFYTEEYNNVIKQAQAKYDSDRENLKKATDELRKSILEEDKAFGEIIVDKTTRQKVYDSIMTPTYVDPNTGNRYTALQKYEQENKLDFIKNIGLAYVLTDGFKNIEKLVGQQVKKQMKKGLRELEHTISSTSRTSTGSLKYTSGAQDPNSKYTKWDIDI